ncbi:MAG: DUF4271 domain-containing protein [Flavobacteriales bacterium]|jgi:hypothetical protein
MEIAIARQATQLSEDWMFLVFLLVIAPIAWTKATQPGRISRVWQSSINVRLLRQVIREEPNTTMASWILNSAFYLSGALLIYLTIKFYLFGKYHVSLPWGLNGIVLYLFLLVILLITYFIKSLTPSIVAFFSGRDNGLSEYRFTIQLTNRLAVFILFPSALAAAYLPLAHAEYAILTGLSLWGFALIYRLLRASLNAIQSGIPVFYILFYICTLEILPILICFRALNP